MKEKEKAEKVESQDSIPGGGTKIPPKEKDK